MRKLVTILVLLAPLVLYAGDSKKRVLVAREGDSFLEKIDDVFVLHLAGTPREMGLAYGKLLRDQVRACAVVPPEERIAAWKKAEPFVPREYLEEMRGIADGAGVPLERIEAECVAPEGQASLGVAVFGKATRDGRLYHLRAIDEWEGILIVRKPASGYATAVFAPPGSVACGMGLNEHGISIGETSSVTSRESAEGTPAGLRVRWILENARALQEGMKGFSEWTRTKGYNFILADSKIPDARAVEVDRVRCAFFAPGGAEENVEPHVALPDCVRRTKHFVDPELARHQRKVYDPHGTESFRLYDRLAESIRGKKLDAESVLALRRGVVFEGSKIFLGGTEHTFDLKDLLATDPGKLELQMAAHELDRTLREGKAVEQKLEAFDKTLTDLAERLESGVPPHVRAHEQLVAALGGEPTGEASEPALDGRDDEEATARALKLFVRPAGKFPYRIVEKDRHETYVRHELHFPSAAHTTDPSDFVHGFYYEPLRVDGREPAAVVVHHLGGSFEAEEVLAAYLAQHGVASVTLALPGYGKRRAQGQPRAGFLGHKDPVDDLAGMRQAVLDVRRCADVLRTRPEVDPARVGVVGVSLGALVAADAAGIDPRFARAVFVIGGGDFLKVLMGPSKEAQEAMKHIREIKVSPEDLKKGFDLVDPLTFARRLRSQDVFMLNAEHDEIFPRESTLELWRKAGFPRIKWYNCGHYGIVAHLPSVMNETLDFLLKKAPEREPD